MAFPDSLSNFLWKLEKTGLSLRSVLKKNGTFIGAFAATAALTAIALKYNLDEKTWNLEDLGEEFDSVPQDDPTYWYAYTKQGKSPKVFV